MKKSNNKHFRVLAVDDDETILDLYQKILSPDNPLPAMPIFKVTCCPQGNAAVDEVERSLKENTPFAVAFLDVWSSGISFAAPNPRDQRR